MNLASPNATTCSKPCMEAHRQCTSEEIAEAWRLLGDGYLPIGNGWLSRLAVPRFADAVYFAGDLGRSLPVLVTMRDALFDQAMDARAGKMTDPTHDRLMEIVVAVDKVLDVPPDAVR